jgi:uncharacterized protein
MYDEATIAEAARRIVAAAPGAEVLVFGSYARGDADDHSDLDLLVIVSEVENTSTESVRLRRELNGLRLAVDLVVLRRSYVEEWRDVPSSFVETVMTEGRLLAA